MSGLVKDYDLVFDLGKYSGTKKSLREVIKECAVARPPPLTPAAFATALSTKAFTSQKADEAVVARLYAETFHKQMGAATELKYSRLRWGDAEIAALCKVATLGALANLTVLRLEGNQIGVEGIAALANLVTTGALPSISRINVDSNPASNILLLEKALVRRSSASLSTGPRLAGTPRRAPSCRQSTAHRTDPRRELRREFPSPLSVNL